MNVGEVMTQEVISVTPSTTVKDAVNLMLKERISGLPVINEAHALVGIVTEGDFLRRAEIDTEQKRPRWLAFLFGPAMAAAEYIHSHSRKVADVMTANVVVADEDMPLDEAVSLMERTSVKRLPVLRHGRVVGILARANLLRALAALPADSGYPADDKDLRDRIAKELAKQSWKVRDCQILVRGGVVHLWGLVPAEQQRKAFCVLAENVPGVKAVRNHVSVYAPITGLVVQSPPDGYDPASADTAERRGS